MKDKKIVLVTSGGLMEYIDDVRVITNVSSGRLGATIAARLAELRLGDDNIKVYYMHGKRSIMPREISTAFMDSDISYFEVRTALDAYSTLHRLLTNEYINMVIHSMAVSDFTFNRSGSVKLKSNSPEAFVDYLRSTITLNPKIISFIKTWAPETSLVGFKFEVGASKEELYELAQQSIAKNGCDLVVANDKNEMKLRRDHVAHFIYKEEIATRYGLNDSTVISKETIALSLTYFARKILFDGTNQTT